MRWCVETLRRRQKRQRPMQIRSRDTSGDSRSLRKSPAVAPRRSSATPYAKPPVCHHTRATTRITFEERTNSRPHAGRNGLLLFADSIGIDGGDFQDGVAHPLGEEVQGDALVEAMDGLGMQQCLGDTMWPGSDVRLFHHGDHTPPRRGARPGPQRLIEFGLPTAALDFFQTVYHVERIQQGEGYRDGAVHTFPTFLEAF